MSNGFRSRYSSYESDPTNVLRSKKIALILIPFNKTECFYCVHWKHILVKFCLREMYIVMSLISDGSRSASFAQDPVKKCTDPHR